MAYKNYDEFWRSVFYNNVSARSRVQDKNLNQLKLKVNDTFKEHEKVTTSFEPSIVEAVINKACLDKELSIIEGHLSLIEKYYNEFKLLSNKQSAEEVLIEKVMKTTVHILYDKGLFDNYDNADEVTKVYLLIERRRHDLSEVNDVIQ